MENGFHNDLLITLGVEMLTENEILNFQTPKFLADLGHTFLFVREGETVADIACGTGEFLKYVARKEENVSLYGCELNEGAYEKLISNDELNSKRVSLEKRDAFSLIGEKEFDKVFVHPPFCKRMQIKGELEDLLKETLQGEGFCRETSNSDLMFSLLATQLIKDDGYAVVVVSASSCSNSAGKFLRKWLVDGGYLNMVISLPPKMLDNTSVPIVALGLCKNSESVRMVDATGFGTKEGRRALREGPGVGGILLAFDAGSEDVFDVSMDEIAKTEYDFLPEKYFNPPFSYKYSVSLSEVLVVARRGVINGNKSKTYLEQRKQHTNTFPFVRSCNIEDGVFSGNLDKIESEFVPSNAIPLAEGDILLSKTGKPFKCAVVDHLCPCETFFQENLYMLRCDRTKIDPYYLCAFFISDKGQKTLSRAMVDGGTTSLPIKKLKQVKVPLPQMSKQQKIGIEFQHLCDDVKDSKLKVKQAVSSLKFELRDHF